ncbi:MAG: glycosyltransferase [Elusimicrobiota bacterium]
MAGFTPKLENLKVALVHDWLTGMRGGEKVLEKFCELFPQADIYTLLWMKGSVSGTIESHAIRTSFLQSFPFVDTKYRYYLPLMPAAIRSFKLRNYDLVISTSHCVAKGIIKPRGAKHLCYCFTPMRYIWDQYEQYFSAEKSGILTRTAMKFLRPWLQNWDRQTASGIDKFTAISRHVAKRIEDFYGRKADIIYPPADTENYPQHWNGGYFLVVSALVPYKKVDLAVKAFNATGYPLKIIGSGPELEKLKSSAKGNIEFLGWLTDEQIKRYYAGCRGFVFPQEEDFGITAVEAQACGKPVIAFAKGGALETVINGETGVFFSESTPESLNAAVEKSISTSFSAEKIILNARRFSEKRFMNEIRESITNFMQF